MTAAPSAAVTEALREPPPLGAGARVALVSPSGPLAGPHELERAIETAEALGWVPQVGRHALSRDGYFAGNDASRAEDLVEALTDADVDGIWCLRGGYGAARLLPRLWPHLETASPKALLGYSDITALHAAWQRAGIVSFHAPTARTGLSAFSRDHLVRAVQTSAPLTLYAPGSTVLRAGQASGRLVGGNLALVASLCGTPWACDFRGALAIFEDINEATYRLDRMLTQLLLAGALDGCTGLVFGHFTDCPDTTEDGTRSLTAVVNDVADALQVPALLGVPIGHIADQWTVPLGAWATLDTATRQLHVRSLSTSSR